MLHDDCDNRGGACNACRIFPDDDVAGFCLAWEEADAISAHILYEEGGLVLVKDIAEFRKDWAESRPEAVSEYVAGRRVRLHSLRYTGVYRGGDEEVEYLSQREIPARA